MPALRQLAAREIALTACFTALYVVLSFLPMFQLIGFLGKTITAATIIAPIMGIMLGTYLGVVTTLLGGTIGLFINPLFSQPSLAAGVIAALFASMLYTNKRGPCILIYTGLLLGFGFYPSVGPVWLYPPQMWFQTAGLFLLASPLQSMATKNLNSNTNSKLLPAFFITCLTSTLASQIAGSLVYEAIFWPTIHDTNSWGLYWKSLTFLYPLERTTIASLAALTGASLYKVLKTTNLLPLLSRLKERGVRIQHASSDQIFNILFALKNFLFRATYFKSEPPIILSKA